MIAGIKPHTCDAALAAHLVHPDHNESVTVRTVGLASEDAWGALREIRAMSTGCRSRQPGVHIWASPASNLTEDQWGMYWADIESEFDLEMQPYLEVAHRKLGAGRTAAHMHRIYLRILPNRKAIALSQSYPRMEKISRRHEIRAGERLTRGGHNRAVVAALRSEGRQAEAEIIDRAGLTGGPRPIAVSSTERAMTERAKGPSADEVWRLAFEAWRRSDSATALVSALAEAGLSAAQGERRVVIVTPGGTIHSLRRAVANGARRAGHSAIRKRDVDTRLGEFLLPSLDSVRKRPAGPVLPVFRVTELDRSIPVPETVNHPPPAEHGAEPGMMSARPVPAESAYADIEPQLLSAEQLKAMQRFDIALLEDSAQYARQMRRLAEEAAAALAETRAKAVVSATATARTQETRQAIDAADEQTRMAQLADRVREIRADYDSPAIGQADWRDHLKADLAGLPRKYGPVLRWVDRQDEYRRRLVLTSGTVVTVALDRFTASAPTADTVPTMVAAAQKRRWRTITISGGTAQWQEAMARAAVRAGLEIADPHLEEIVRDELGGRFSP